MNSTKDFKITLENMTFTNAISGEKWLVQEAINACKESLTMKEDEEEHDFVGIVFYDEDGDGYTEEEMAGLILEK